MPMKRELYPLDWERISLSARIRADWRCEQCGIAHGAPLPSGRKGGVVLTVAHLNHAAMDCRPENLRVMCQKCHLAYDREHHLQNAALTRARKRELRRVWVQLLLWPDLPQAPQGEGSV